MIRYTLRCENEHQFESWFKSADAFETLSAGGMLSCAICGSGAVSKSLMAPSVATGGHTNAPAALEPPQPPAAQPPAPVPEAQPGPGALSQAESPLEKAIEQLREKVESTSSYVGRNFASEARRMHEGDAPSRAIHGEANQEEARALLEDGVPVMPLPFGPKNKGN